VNGYDYWRSRLAPLAAQGFRRGVLTATTVVLYRGDGAKVVLPRPGRRWISGSDLDAVLEEDRQVDPDVAEGFRALRFLEPGDVE
jgi:hypothetical protein